MPASTPVKVVFGAMLFGPADHEVARTHNLSDAAAILDTFQSHGHTEVDTARIYTGGQSEAYLARLSHRTRGLAISTKLWAGPSISAISSETYTFAPQDVRRGLERSLSVLETSQIDIFYLHVPDHETPIEGTLRAVDALYREGKFRRFGVSNYSAWAVAQMCEIAKANGWVMPSVYQGVYNAWHRSVEAELFPCLRHYGIAFYVYSPLAGGFLTGRYTREQTEYESGSRFDPSKFVGKFFQARYANEAHYRALDVLRPVAEKHGLSIAECAMRWVGHHSMLRKERGDAVIIGASSLKHTVENLEDLEKGPLPEEVVQALDAGWAETKAVADAYYR